MDTTRVSASHLAATSNATTQTAAPDDGAATSQLETELKFSACPALLRKLRKCGPVKRAARGKAVSRRLESTYFDTRQHRMRKAGAALRIRRSGNRLEQTLKLPGDGPAGMQNFEEFNIAVADDRPDLGRFGAAVVRQLPGNHRQLTLRPVFTTEVYRFTRELAYGGARFEMALDEGRLVSHNAKPRTMPVSEVEFELLDGDATDMLDFVLGLCEKFDLLPFYLTKAQRGYALARPALRPRRAKAAKVELDTHMSVGQAFEHIAAEGLRQLQCNLQPALEGQPGGIHQARVAMRRIRAALRAFKTVLPYHKRKAFNGEFRWFQSRLAPARDWHVFLSETLPQIRDHSGAGDMTPDRLHKRALKERRRATAEARDVLQSRRFSRLVLQFQRWLLGLEAEHGELFDMPVRPFAADVLDKTQRDFLADSRPLSRMSEEDRHSLRKRGKKARYAMEFFASLWNDPGVKPYLNLTETVQDHLGAANDAVVARVLLASLPPRALNRSAQWRVQDWSQARELECIRAGQPVWRRMQRAQPFWR